VPWLTIGGQPPAAQIGGSRSLDIAVRDRLAASFVRRQGCVRLDHLGTAAAVHAGEVHYDANGCFGEVLDIAFRLLDAANVKKALQAAADPLTLVISGDIYRVIVRHGYDGIDQRTFHPLVRVHIAGNRYPGWIHIPGQPDQNQVTEIASYRQPA